MNVNVKLTLRNIEDTYGTLTKFAAAADSSQPMVSLALRGKSSGPGAIRVLDRLKAEGLLVENVA